MCDLMDISFMTNILLANSTQIKLQIRLRRAMGASKHSVIVVGMASHCKEQPGWLSHCSEAWDSRLSPRYSQEETQEEPGNFSLTSKLQHEDFKQGRFGEGAGSQRKRRLF